MTIESPNDIQGLLRVGRVVGLAIQAMRDAVRPGMSTLELDAIGAAVLKQHGARSAPILTYKYPGNTCISINDEVAHGIPTADRVIQPGDLVNVDVSAELDGFYADAGYSQPVPPISPDTERLCNSGQQALEIAINAARAGQPLYAIGKAVQTYADKQGYRIIRELNGHGVGRKLHEEPRNIPNHFNRTATTLLKEGMVITLEPFLTPGKGKIYTLDDKWTLKTTDGKVAVQYEHTVIITKERPILVTAV
ncbi:MAG: type I methionyl aminopeptidase [bacterium]|nr:type I methionyl aminopeptidase [bacterium]